MQNQSLKQQIKNHYALILVILAVGILISSVIYISAGKNANTSLTANANQHHQVAQPQAQSLVDISNVNIDGNPFVGQTSAQVVVAEWFDYQCPFCKREDQGVLNQVYENYIKTGKVKLVYKDFPFLGSDSGTAAIAGRAVWEVAPDKFYAWHEAMFEKQAGENSGWASKANILSLTESLGIDAEKVGQLMTSKAGEYQKAIDADKAEASGFGISGTPSFIIGKQLIIGAQPYSALQSAIDAQLKPAE